MVIEEVAGAAADDGKKYLSGGLADICIHSNCSKNDKMCY